jgi:hypothetical protein
MTVAVRWGKFGLAVVVAIFVVGGFFGFRYLFTDSIARDVGLPNASESGKEFYWEMDESEQLGLIRDRSHHIFILIGDDPSPLSDDEVGAIKRFVDQYVERRNSLSQQQFEEGLRSIYGRASQYSGPIRRSYQDRNVPAVVGIYQAMIESEYRDCPLHPHERGPVGLFQFSRRTAEQYGIGPADLCNVEKQADAAARLMSDLLSDFGSERGSWTLALLSFNNGSDEVREYLRQTRSRGHTDRTYWAIRRDRQNFVPPLEDEKLVYVIRFFAAAIIGETPSAFDLPIPPLSTV